MEPAAALAAGSHVLDRGDHHYFSFGGGGADPTTALFDELLAIEAARPGAPVRLVVDIRQAHASTPDSTRTVLRRHREFHGRRVAVVGPSGMEGAIVDVLIRATGFRDAKYFSDEASALRWLRGP